MSKPTVTGTSHLLPFNRLSPGDFERLCLWTIKAEGYERVEHTGWSGRDSGLDIVAAKERGNAHDGIWIFQCKRRVRVSAAQLKEEVSKIGDFVSSEDIPSSVVVVFVTACPVSAQVRLNVRKHAHGLPFAVEFWAETELDERVKRHDHIVREFFQRKVLPEESAPKVELPLDEKILSSRRYQRMFEGLYLLLRFDQIAESGSYSKSDAYTCAKLEHAEEYPRDRKIEGGFSQCLAAFEALRSVWKNSPRLFDQPYVKRLMSHIENRRALDGGFGVEAFMPGFGGRRPVGSFRHTTAVVTILSSLLPDTHDLVQWGLDYIKLQLDREYLDSLASTEDPSLTLANFIFCFDLLATNESLRACFSPGELTAYRLAGWADERSRFVRALATHRTHANAVMWRIPKALDDAFDVFASLEVLALVPDLFAVFPRRCLDVLDQLPESRGGIRFSVRCDRPDFGSTANAVCAVVRGYPFLGVSTEESQRQLRDASGRWLAFMFASYDKLDAYDYVDLMKYSHFLRTPELRPRKIASPVLLDELYEQVLGGVHVSNHEFGYLQDIVRPIRSFFAIDGG